MLTNLDDPVRTRLIEAELALSAVVELLDVPVERLQAGERSKAESFVAKAPPVQGHARDTERLFVALDVAVSAIKADATFGGGYALVASCLYRMGATERGYDSRTLLAALPWACRAVAVDPNCVPAWQVLLEIHSQRGDKAAADQTLATIRAHYGESALLARCAFLCCAQRGQNAQALHWGARARELESDKAQCVDTLLALGRLHAEAGDWTQAADCFREATKADPGCGLAWHEWARAVLNLGDASTALELSGRALACSRDPALRTWHDQLRRNQGLATPVVAPPRVTERLRPDGKVKPTARITPPPRVATAPVVRATPTPSVLSVGAARQVPPPQPVGEVKRPSVKLPVAAQRAPKSTQKQLRLPARRPSRA